MSQCSHIFKKLVKSSVALSYVSFRHTCVLCSTGRSTCPECSTPNPQPAPLRGHTSTCPMAPRKAAPSTAPWSRTADSGRFDTGSMCSWEVASPNCWSPALHKLRLRRPSPEKISRCWKEQKCAKVKMQGLVQLQTFQSCERCKERNQLLFFLPSFVSLFCWGFFSPLVMHLWQCVL